MYAFFFWRVIFFTMSCFEDAEIKGNNMILRD